jgi:predicted nucleic acid-binding protein
MSGEIRFAVDTSFVIALLKGAIESRRALSEVAFPFALVGELRFGALGGRDPQRKLAEIDDIIRRGLMLLTLDHHFGRIEGAQLADPRLKA